MTSARAELAIIPAVNEAATVGSVVAELRERSPDIDVLVVDDGSADATRDVARVAGALVASHRFRLGYGAALQTGYRYALRAGYELCVQLDADGQHDPAAVPSLLQVVRDGRADVVLGSRFAGGLPDAVSRPRRLGVLFLRALARLLAGIVCSDPTSGFRAMDRRALALLSRIVPDDYPDLDVLIALRAEGLRIAEVAVASRPRVTGRSMHSGIRPVYYAYKMTLASVMAAIRAQRRMQGAR